MQLFRVKDCKQMGKKNEPIGFRIYILSARFHIYPIQYQIEFLYCYVVGGLALIIFLFNRFGWCPPFTHLFSVSLRCVPLGGLFGGISCASLSWWGRFASRFT